jgi:oligopeptidase A
MPEHTAADNPLLVERLPIQFNAIATQHVEPAVQALLEQMNERLRHIAADHIPATYENILIALDTMTEPLDYAISVVRHLEAVVTTPELRAAYNAVQAPVSMFYSSIPLDANLWAAVKSVSQSREVQALGPVHQRFLQKTVTGFRRAGADRRKCSGRHERV